jgi:hypothetical protein
LQNNSLSQRFYWLNEKKIDIRPRIDHTLSAPSHKDKDLFRGLCCEGKIRTSVRELADMSRSTLYLDIISVQIHFLPCALFNCLSLTIASLFVENSSL